MTEFEFVSRGRAVFLPGADAVVVADLHLGRSRSPRVRTAIDDAVDFGKRIRRILAQFDADRLVIAGDLLDAFDTVPPGVPDRFADLCRAVADADAELTVLRGNHDTMLASLYDDTIHDVVTFDGTIVCHGHELPDERGVAYVIGHEHPAIRIEGVKRPCLLHGPDVFAGADVLVLPPFSPLVRGTVFNSREHTECVSPLVRKTPIERYRPIVPETDGDDALTFPPLGTLREFL